MSARNCEGVLSLPVGLAKLSYECSLENVARLFGPASDRKHYYLGENYPGIYFTSQEARCMVFFLDGMTNEQVGKYLGLSDRTVGSYASNIQRKLRLKNKKSMVEAVKQTDFFRQFVRPETECMT